MSTRKYGWRRGTQQSVDRAFSVNVNLSSCVLAFTNSLGAPKKKLFILSLFILLCKKKTWKHEKFEKDVCLLPWLGRAMALGCSSRELRAKGVWWLSQLHAR